MLPKGGGVRVGAPGFWLLEPLSDTLSDPGQSLSAERHTCPAPRRATPRVASRERGGAVVQLTGTSRLGGAAGDE